jgi:hypothetical protein
MDGLTLKVEQIGQQRLQGLTMCEEDSDAIGSGSNEAQRQIGAEVLHLYAQPFWHVEAYLSGGRGALMALREAIEKALHHGDGKCDLFTSDGEGYTVHVVAMSDEEAQRQVVPYTDECAAQSWRKGFGPWDVLRPR